MTVFDCSQVLNVIFNFSLFLYLVGKSISLPVVLCVTVFVTKMSSQGMNPFFHEAYVLVHMKLNTSSKRTLSRSLCSFVNDQRS